MQQYNFNNKVIIFEKPIAKSLLESISLWLVIDIDFIIEQEQENNNKVLHFNK